MQKTAYYVTEGTPFSGWVGPVEELDWMDRKTTLSYGHIDTI
jgi:hypothetical protein